MSILHKLSKGRQAMGAWIEINVYLELQIMYGGTLQILYIKQTNTNKQKDEQQHSLISYEEEL